MKALGKQILCAGSLLDEKGKMKGSALGMEFPDRGRAGCVPCQRGLCG